MTNDLEKALSAIASLPSDTQDALAAELMTAISVLQSSGLSPEQQAVVDARLATPQDLADPSDVAAVFAKY